MGFALRLRESVGGDALKNAAHHRAAGQPLHDEVPAAEQAGLLIEEQDPCPGVPLLGHDGLDRRLPVRQIRRRR